MIAKAEERERAGEIKIRVIEESISLEGEKYKNFFFLKIF